MEDKDYLRGLWLQTHHHSFSDASCCLLPCLGERPPSRGKFMPTFRQMKGGQRLSFIYSELSIVKSEFLCSMVCFGVTNPDPLQTLYPLVPWPLLLTEHLSSPWSHRHFKKNLSCQAIFSLSFTRLKSPS